MKPRLEHVSAMKGNHSFLCYELNVPDFDFYWHYHPEYELTCILQGRGKKLVGDSYENFREGDLVLLGPNLPHTWISDKRRKENCRAIVIQFSPAFVEQILQFWELTALEKLFINSYKGLQLNHVKTNQCVTLMQEMIGASEVHKFSLLLQVFDLLSTMQATSLASAKYRAMKGNDNQQRINQVFQYVEREFKQGLSLKKAADSIHLSQSAFCKFFKRASGKTFSDYTNDIRIAHACQLLMETDKPIRAIALESGFESLTYFNRVFLKKKKLRPGAFRKL
jgi:AraC-like DNA-binding protein/mannose-6-phosphate isomerase-like protein (cupin superfamily)